MTEKFNAKKYRGKQRIYTRVQNGPGISRLWYWSGERQQYEVPLNAKTFVASKYHDSIRMKQFFDTLDEARAWQRTETPVARVSATVCGPTFSDVLEKWKSARWSKFAESTRVFYEDKFIHFDTLMKLPIDSFKPDTIDQFLIHMKSPEKLKTYKASRLSFEKELELLKTILKWHLDNDDDTKLVMPFRSRHWEMSFLRKRTKLKRLVMQTQERDAFLEAMEKISPMFSVFAKVQMAQIFRISEVAAMKFPNLDLARQQYRVCEHVMWVRRKGVLPELKSGTKNMKDGEAIMPLRSELVDVLRALPKRDDTDLLFSNEGKLLTYREIYNTYNRASKKAGLPLTGTHILRHTGATEFLEETGDALALTQMGNWASMDMAMHYGKITKDRASRAVQAADQKRHLVIVTNQSRGSVG